MGQTRRVVVAAIGDALSAMGQAVGFYLSSLTLIALSAGVALTRFINFFLAHPLRPLVWILGILASLLRLIFIGGALVISSEQAGPDGESTMFSDSFTYLESNWGQALIRILIAAAVIVGLELALRFAGRRLRTRSAPDDLAEQSFGGAAPMGYLPADQLAGGTYSAPPGQPVPPPGSRATEELRASRIDAGTFMITSLTLAPVFLLTVLILLHLVVRGGV